MKSPIQLILGTILFLSSLLGTPGAFAGGESSGGGQVVRLPDDTVVLADPFIARSGDVRNLSPELQTELELIEKLLNTYRITLRKLEIGRFETEYRFADETQMARILQEHGECREHVVLNGEHQGLVFGCTQGNITWLLESRFKQMSVREQAKAIIHERMHTLNGIREHSDIADFTDGVETLLALTMAQANGSRDSLTPRQRSSMELLFRRAAQLELALNNSLGYWKSCGSGFPVVLNAHGGVKAQERSQHLGFVGAGSCVAGDVHATAVVLASNVNGHVGPNARIIASRIEAKGDYWGYHQNLCSIEEGARIINSIFWCSVVGSRSTVKNVTILTPGSAPFDFEPMVSVSNIGESNVYPRWNFGRITFKRGAKIDLEGRPVCAGWLRSPRFLGGVADERELAGLCHD